MDTAPLRYAYLAPTQRQAKEICWTYFKDACAKIPDVKINESELRITFGNKASIKLLSGESFESMRGIYLDGCVSDEDDDIPVAAMKYVILPCLLDYNGWHCSMGTPKGKGTLYRNIQRAKDDPNRFGMVLRADESGIISDEDLAEIRAETGEEAYKQEMLCDFNVARIGAVFAHHIDKARDSGRVINFEPDQNHLVYTTWDLGSPKNLVVNYWQKIDLTYRLIDCDHSLELTTAQRVAHMLDKGYNYANHFLPHDGRARGADNLNFKDKLLTAGLRNVEVLDRVPADAVGKRIRAMIDLFPQIWFNEQNLSGDQGFLDALENYHFKEMKKDGHVTSVPEHDWSSHFADAFCYFAEALQSGRMLDNLSKRGLGRAKASFGKSL